MGFQFIVCTILADSPRLLKINPLEPKVEEELTKSSTPAGVALYNNLMTPGSTLGYLKLNRYRGYWLRNFDLEKRIIRTLVYSIQLKNNVIHPNTLA